MRILACCFLILAARLPAAAPADSPTPARSQDVRIMVGDDPRWAATDWDDRNWPKLNPRETPGRAGIYWVRWRVAWLGQHLVVPDAEARERLRALPADRPINAIRGATACSFDFYWDGRLLLRNGVVGSSRAAEVPGRVDTLISIPSDLLGPGPHLAAVRISSYHFNFPGESSFMLLFGTENFETMNNAISSGNLFPMIGIGCSLVSAVICGLLFWLVDRRRPLLLCSFFSLTVAAYFLMASWRTLSGLLFKPELYNQIFPLSIAAQALMAVIGCLLLLVFLEQFALPGRVGWLAALGLLYGVIWFETWGRVYGIVPGIYVAMLWECRAALLVSAVAAGSAMWRRRTGAPFALAAALFGLATVRLTERPAHNLLTPSFLATFALLVLAVLAAIGLEVQAARRAARAAELTAARMEIELLKKNLQPHFLLNTLTTLSEVVEQSPQEAVRLIGDLADEFRALSRMSSEKLIPLSQELDLCHAHLRVMSLRMGKAWRLEAENLDLTARIPPALFLTLIENGFAHQRVTAPGAAFVLRQEFRPDGTTLYLFESPGRKFDDPDRVPGGTGLRYVKARLEESFASGWSFRDGPTVAGWETVIEIR